MVKEILDEQYADDHEKQRIDFFVPDAPRGEVALLFIHGGGWEKGGKEQWHAVAKHFANLGYMSASAGYRLTDSAVYPAQPEDTEAALLYMKRQSARFGFNPQRVLAIGSSAGGYLAAMLAIAARNEGARTQGAILYCPVTDLLAGGDFIRKFMGCPPEGNERLYREASPLCRITGAEPPFLILQGDADKTTPLQQAEAFHGALLKAGANSELEVLEGVGHGFGYGTETAAQAQAIRRMEAYLQVRFPGQA
ncbi:alpha/beta hydrolase [Paenibacillus piri]|uniref:Alpha/beta hydrolase n=1 Tax=Paenibacillus piri TaxID=2547395 RepID=A0A4R5KXM0_9BACL|nr:alpha/beta hydrolase [Paenibacillus piri]TDG00820.1 alpha/beta hydrolase [Paenibacillus piri]